MARFIYGTQAACHHRALVTRYIRRRHSATCRLLAVFNKINSLYFRRVPILSSIVRAIRAALARGVRWQLSSDGAISGRHHHIFSLGARAA